MAAIDVDPLPLASLIVSADGSAVESNDVWQSLTGLSAERSLGSGWMRAVHTASRWALADRLGGAVAKGESGCDDWRLEVPVGADAGERWTRWWWRPRTHRDVLVCVADIQGDRAREADLWYQATHDHLTGLVNRFQLLSAVEQARERSKRTASVVAVLFSDLDDFKSVNDTYGHRVGDDVLRRVAARLRAAVRPADVVARLGGDEFAVLCEDITSAEAALVAQRLCAVVSRPIELPGTTLVLSASIGVAIASGGGETADDLLGRADRAMYGSRNHRLVVPGVVSTLDLRADPAPLRK